MKGKNTLDAGNTIALLQKASFEFQQGQLDNATAHIQKILTLNKAQPDANHLMGLIAYQRGQYALARQLISHAIKVNPHQPVFHFNLARVMQELKQLRESIWASSTIPAWPT